MQQVTDQKVSGILGENIKKVRKSAGMTQKELAERMKVY